MMRRLMKGKRRKSENPSDAESEENGGNAHKSDDVEQTKPDDDGESAPKSKRRAVRSRENNKLNNDDVATKKDKGDETDDELLELGNQENGNAGKSMNDKRRKLDQRKATTSQEVENEQEYEVERIISYRTIKGRRQFLIRWKGYNDDADTWKDEDELNCSKLIDDFLTDKEIEQEKPNDEKSEESHNSKPDENNLENDEVTKRSLKNKRMKTPKRMKKTATPAKKRNSSGRLENSGNGNDKSNDTIKKGKNAKKTRQQNLDVKKHKESDKNINDEKEFEVERIIDVYFKKNKSREFLIRWKGFPPSDDTWEPEANLNCAELITKFMNKVEKAKTSDLRELRTNPSHTKRYTLTMPGKGRRLSRRNAGKERATYHECDE